MLKQTSPTAWPVAPKPKPSSTVPSASTSSAVGSGSSQRLWSAVVSASASAYIGAYRVCGRHQRLPRMRGGARPRRILQEAIAVLRDEINNALKDAMKAGDARRVSTLRLINAEILKRETSAAERVTLNDAEILDVMGKMIKQRQESLEIYEKAGPHRTRRPGARGDRRSSPATCRKQMSDIEAGEAISSLIKELEAATLKDMGRTMTALKERFAGRWISPRPARW